MIPPSAFIDPYGKNASLIRGLMDHTVDLVLKAISTAADQPPLPPMQGFWRPKEIPEEGIAEDQIFENLNILIQGAMNPANPGYMGHMDPPPTTFSILGDMVASALNNNMLCFEMSPSFTVLEKELLKLFAKFFGLGPGSGGIMVSGGSLGNLAVISLARNVWFGTHKESLAILGKAPVLLASDAAHTSIHKAAMILGLGLEAVINVPTDVHGRMDIKELERLILLSQQQGKVPFCVVCTAGTTVTGMIDPIDSIHEIARKYDLWMHVDAVYGGALIFSDKHRHLLKGIEKADSISFNPQKWLCVTKTCALFLIKDISMLEKAFRIPAPYMSDHDEGPNLGEISIQGTRYPDILKLWLSLQHFGRRGWEKLVDVGMELRQFFIEQIDQRPFLEYAYKPDVNVVCFRLKLKHAALPELNQWNTTLQKYLLQEKGLFVSLPDLHGQTWLKAVLINPNINKSTLIKLFESIDEFCKTHRLIIH